MLGEQGQHVVEEGNSSVDRGCTLAVDIQAKRNAGFFGHPLDGSLALRHFALLNQTWSDETKNELTAWRVGFASPGFGVLKCLMRVLICALAGRWAIVIVLATWPLRVAADSNEAHRQTRSETPQPWPGGVIPYDISRLTPPQQTNVLKAMQRWMDTGAALRFIPRTGEVEYVNFTGATNAGNNTSCVGFKKGVRADINITTFWWGQQEWMVVHELGHVLGFFHEHQRWDRDHFVTIHYDHIKPGRAGDYDWISKTNWIVNSLPYDFRSIMHYRICWASNCESRCKDGVGSSPCAVIEPLDKAFDGVIGQWSDNGISALDGERARLVYGLRTTFHQPEPTK
jgi:hypothetical protein